MNKIIIVNNKDQIIGFKERTEIQQKDIYRVAGLWITNSKKEVLLAQRSFNKNHDPGKWGPAVAGTVEEGENYEENIQKEAKEEIGLENIKLKKGPKTESLSQYHYFCQWFLLEIDKDVSDFKIKKDEVEQVKWFSKKELIGQIEENPKKFLNGMLERVKLLCK